MKFPKKMEEGNKRHQKIKFNNSDLSSQFVLFLSFNFLLCMLLPFRHITFFFFSFYRCY